MISGAASVMNALFKWAAVLLAYRVGIRKERQRAAEEGLKRARQAAKIDENVDNLSDDERWRWLYNSKRD